MRIFEIHVNRPLPPPARPKFYPFSSGHNILEPSGWPFICCEMEHKTSLSLSHKIFQICRRTQGFCTLSAYWHHPSHLLFSFLLLTRGESTESTQIEKKPEAWGGITQCACLPQGGRLLEQLRQKAKAFLNAETLQGRDNQLRKKKKKKTQVTFLLLNTWGQRWTCLFQWEMDYTYSSSSGKLLELKLGLLLNAFHDPSCPHLSFYWKTLWFGFILS